MQRLAKPPSVEPASIQHALSQLDNPVISEFIAKANSEYYHWDELRRRPLPLGLTPEAAWAAVKFSRMQSRRALPLSDTQGRPFGYWIPDRALHVLHQIDRMGGGLLAAADDDASILPQFEERMLIDSLMEEAIASSQIEGAVTTRKIAKDMLRAGRAPRDRSEQMIVNGYRTVRLLRERKDQPLSVNLLHEIQENMTVGTLDDPRQSGRFRTDADRVVVVDTRDNEIVFTPPPANQLETRMRRLIDFANAKPNAEPFIHPLVRAAILHFWLAYEHPYVDGNGRTARALFYWYMLRQRYWLFEFITISRIIHSSPSQYYRSFVYSETDDNDLTYSLTFMLNVTHRALDDLHNRLAEVTDQQRRMSALRLAQNLNARQQALLDHALRNPHQIYSFESHRNSNNVSYQTARSDVLELVHRGLLVEVGRKPLEFQPAPNLKRKLGLQRA